MTTILGTVAIIALLWTALSALPAGLEARMPLPYMIALTPLLWVPLVVLAAFAAWQREWSVMSLLIVAALFASSHRLNYWGTSIDPAGKRKESHRETPRETSANTQNMNNSSNADNTVTVSSSTIDTNRETSRETSVNTHNISDPNAGPSAAASSSGTAGTSREALDAASNLSSTASESTRTTLPTQFTVMTLNCRYGRADANDITANIRKRGISVLALQEVTDELIARLTEAGLNELLPYHQFGEAKDTDNGGFNVLYSAYEPGASVPNVVSIPAADVPAITLRIADQAKMPPASTSTNGITIRIATNPSAPRPNHHFLLGSSEIPYARLCRLVGRNPRITRDHQSSVHRPSQHRCRDGRPQLKHRPPQFPCPAQVWLQGREPDPSGRPQPYVPPLAQVATHRAGSRAVYPRSAAITGQVVRNQGHRSSGTCRHAGASLAACRTSHPRDPLPRQNAHDTHHVSPALRAIIGQLFARAWRPLHPGPRGHVDSGGPCPTW